MVLAHRSKPNSRAIQTSDANRTSQWMLRRAELMNFRSLSCDHNDYRDEHCERHQNFRRKRVQADPSKRSYNLDEQFIASSTTSALDDWSLNLRNDPQCKLIDSLVDDLPDYWTQHSWKWQRDNRPTEKTNIRQKRERSASNNYRLKIDNDLGHRLNSTGSSSGGSSYSEVSSGERISCSAVSRQVRQDEFPPDIDFGYNSAASRKQQQQTTHGNSSYLTGLCRNQIVKSEVKQRPANQEDNQSILKTNGGQQIGTKNNKTANGVTKKSDNQLDNSLDLGSMSPINKNKVISKFRRTLSLTSSINSATSSKKPFNSPELESTMKSAVVGCGDNSMGRKRSMTTYLKQNFCSSDLTWQTDLAEDEDDIDEDEDIKSLDSLFDTKNINDKWTGIESLRGSRANAKSATTLTAITTTETTSKTSSLIDVNRKLCDHELDQCTKEQLKNDLKQALFNFKSSMVNDLRTKQSAVASNLLVSGKPSSSAFSDTFESGSTVSKVHLTRRRFNSSRGGDEFDDISGRRLHLTLDSLKRLVERNLVATLVGLYILVSLTVIVVLILPYVFNFPHSPLARGQLPLGLDPIEEIIPSKHPIMQIQQQYGTMNGQPPAKIMISKSTSTEDDMDLISKFEERKVLPIHGTKVISTIVSKFPQAETPPTLVRIGHKANLVESKQQQPVVPVTSSTITNPAGSGGFKRGASRSNSSSKKATSDELQRQTNQHQSKQRVNASSFLNGMWKMIYNRPCERLRISQCGRSLKSMLNGENLAIGSATISKAILLSDSPTYEATLLPNQFTRAHDQSQVEKTLSRFEPVIDIKCYPLMPLFLCSIHAPKCLPMNQTQVTDSQEADSMVSRHSVKGAPNRMATHSVDEHFSRLVPPCRSFCREALRRCTFFFEVLSLKLIDPVDCDSLPESSNPEICVGQQENSALLKATEIQTCQGDKFRCTDGECIPKKWRCDGYADCTDKSDEDKCSKCNVDTQFYCGQEICINKGQVCNGIRDCRDGRDERQCLRLSNATGVHFDGSRQLEVWSAIKNSWMPVCGAHWSPIPMSHEACQSLGYSRANRTLIEFEAFQPNQTSSRFSARSANGRNVTKEALNRTILVNNPINKRSSSSSGGWFDVASAGTTFIASGDANLGTDASLSGENEHLIGIVEDVASQSTLPVPALNGLGNYDHLVTYQRLRSNGQSHRETSDELAEIDGAEVKLRSIASMLYHGPQSGCLDRPAHQVSNVYLSCQNFQCGRSVTSYSTRVRLLAQQQQQLLQQQQQHSYSTTSSPLRTMKRVIGPDMRSSMMAVTGANNIQREVREVDDETKRHAQHLAADEELDDSWPTGPFDRSELDDSTEEDYLEEESGDNSTRFIDQLANENEHSSRFIQANSEISKRFVVGGIESMPGEFPYLAALHGGPDEVFFCGGVLISINWLLTAAHCVGNRTQADGWMVKVGVTRRIASPAFVRKLRVRKIIKHPNFNQDSLFNNDIALILLEETVEFNQYLRPICLPRANLKLGPDNSKDCVVVGFGKSKFSQEADYLHVAHFVNVPIVQHSVCSNWYSEHGVNLTEGMLCAGYAEGKRDACQGDSGSGLFCRYSNTNQFFVAGVVSFGIKCATPKLPGVYTSVPLYVEWIDSTTREHGYALQ